MPISTTSASGGRARACARWHRVHGTPVIPFMLSGVFVTRRPPPPSSAASMSLVVVLPFDPPTAKTGNEKRPRRTPPSLR